MLQQTTVSTVEKKFPTFIKKYPSLKSFNNSSEKELLIYWSGLGYYRRARNLWKAVNIINSIFNYKIPSDKSLLLSLPGVGSYTSSAIRTIGYNIPDTPVDVNIHRIFSGLYGSELSHRQIEDILKFIWPKKYSRDFTEALMDLASVIKKNKILKIDNFDLKFFLFSKNQRNIFFIQNKNKNKKIIKINFFIIKYKNQIAFLKKSNLNFFDGFEHLPNSNDVITKELYLNDKSKEIKNMVYVITNHKLQISVFEIFINLKNKNFKWYSLKKIKTIPLPTLYKKILNLVS